MKLFGDTKSMSPNNQAFLNGTDTDDSGRGAVMVTPYAQSAWVYTAVSILAQSVAQIPFRISRVKGGSAKKVRAYRSSSNPAHRAIARRALGEDILESGDVVELVKRPHPSMDSNMYFEMLVTWLMLRGEFFVLPLDLADEPVDLSERKPRVRRLLTLNPEMFWHVVRDFDLRAWRYTGSPLMSPLPSEMLLPSEVVQSKLPNPYLFWRGMSPLTVAMTPAQTDYAGEQFQKGLWLNNADTGVIVTTDQILQEEQRRQIESALRERKRKAGTPDRPLFLFGGAKVEKPTLTMMDMQFLETRKFLRQEIFAILKVPESMAGFTGDLNDGGAGGSLDAAKISFIESTVGALCNRIEVAHERIIETFGDDLCGWFDIDSLPIMQAARRARWDTAAKMFAMSVPVEDINESLDLGLPARPWYKKGYLPFNLQDAGAPAEPLPGEEPPDASQEQTEETEKSNPFTRMLKLLAAPAPVQKSKPDVVGLWKKHVNSRKASVNLFKGKIGKVLMKFRSKALAKLDEVHLQKSAGQLAPDVMQRGLVDIIFSHLNFGEAMVAELSAPIRSTLQNGGSELMDEIGGDDAWKYPPKAVTEYIAGRRVNLMGTGKTVRNQVNTTLEEGITNGETHLQLAARVKECFTDMADSEAKRIAMTEVNTAYNTARDLAMNEAGIEYKAWLSSHGPTVREGHAQAEEDYIDNPIPLDEPFVVDGEELMFPGDDSLGASLGNLINCQCIQLAAQKTDEDEKSLTFKIHGYGHKTFSKSK